MEENFIFQVYSVDEMFDSETVLTFDVFFRRGLVLPELPEG